MFPSEEFWTSVVFLALCDIIALLSFKLGETKEREKRGRQDNFVPESRKLPQEHDERGLVEVSFSSKW